MRKKSYSSLSLVGLVLSKLSKPPQTFICLKILISFAFIKA